MKTFLTLLILFITILVNGQSFPESAMVDYFTDNGLSASVKTMQHPSGEYYKDVTYIAYQGPTEDPYVAAYNHTTGKWTGPFKAGESVLTGREPGMIDNHGKPAYYLLYGGTYGTEAWRTKAGYLLSLDR
jgi:hypothetical protein